LAENTFKAAKLGRCLLAQAGTGIGKTIATLYAFLKAMPRQRLDKVFFLTAKTSGQTAPLEALAQLLQPSRVVPLRVLQLVAREKACDRPGKACHGESCDLARGFYDRLAAARQDAVSRGDFACQSVREVAERHNVCRYYLAQELVRWADVVVADYNYQFDGAAVLNAMTLAAEWRVGLLVDEAHNLVERARDMYSVTLERKAVRDALVEAPSPVAKSLRRLLRTWAGVVKGLEKPYIAADSVPEALLTSLGDACSVIDECLVAQPARPDGPLLDMYFDMLAFRQLAENLDKHSYFEIERGARAGDSSIGIRNVVPAPFLKLRLATAHASVLFSATLTPTRFYSDMLGLPDDAAVLDVEPPFSADQLEIRIARGVSTRFAARAHSLIPIADLIGDQFERRPGNYLAFFSSFDYLEQAFEVFASRHSAVPAWRQERRMSDREREVFLRRFKADGEGVAFAVLGGSFSEGVDLPGTQLVGAFVVTLGLPQVNPVNEQMRERMETVFGSGYEYAYLFPGLRKVVQAAGRVIRTPSDRGVVHFIDDRYSRAEVRELFPTWWQVTAA
jgi:DNA excision repair protein ERCC-2